MHLGRDRVICAYEQDGVIVDPGPSTGVETLLAGLGRCEPRALLLTHIHLDHAGASGVLCRRFPDLVVYVHERGAPHLIDPSKLLKSAARLYGDDMERLWGEVAPVRRGARARRSPAARWSRAFGWPTPRGTPPTTSPISTRTRGDAYVGDVAGVRVPPHGFTVPPTPPPDIDLEVWEESLRTLEGWDPAALCLTHFGRHTDVAEQIANVREGLRVQGELARDNDEAGFVAGLRERLAENMSPDAQASFEQAAPPDQLYQGLERYWRKRAEADAA